MKTNMKTNMKNSGRLLGLGCIKYGTISAGLILIIFIVFGLVYLFSHYNRNKNIESLVGASSANSARDAGISTTSFGATYNSGQLDMGMKTPNFQPHSQYLSGQFSELQTQTTEKSPDGTTTTTTTTEIDNNFRELDTENTKSVTDKKTGIDGVTGESQDGTDEGMGEIILKLIAPIGTIIKIPGENPRQPRQNSSQ